MRDTQRSRVYAAEDQVRQLTQRGGTVDFYGSTLSVAPHRTFRDLGQVREYLAQIREQNWGYPKTPPVLVQTHNGARSARWVAPNRIRLPKGQSWAMTELVVLHEYAHHCVWHTHREADHGRRFQTVLCELTGQAIGPEVQTLLVAALHQAH
ncbi:MAG: TIGR04338 family metallohydrolase [Actinomycetia bacterium]|nr:TIGR04338 family metallohydrolase [Actinomycetes bacterium]